MIRVLFDGICSRTMCNACPNSAIFAVKVKTKKMSENNIIITRRYQSPCGEMIIGSMAQMLCLCDWVCDAERRLLIDRRLERHLGAGFEKGTSAVIEQAVGQLDEYFQGKRSVFDVPL